jgi:hypothetical protein
LGDPHLNGKKLGLVACEPVIPEMAESLLRGLQFRLAWVKSKTLFPKYSEHEGLEAWLKHTCLASLNP